MSEIKEKIKNLFCKEIDKVENESVFLDNNAFEMKLNAISENIISRINCKTIPLKQTSNDNYFGEDMELPSCKASDVELPNNNSYNSMYQNTKPKNIESTIPENFDLTITMRNYATKNFIAKEFVDTMFEDFKLYYQSKATLNSDWEAVWKRWVLNNNKYKNHLIKTTIDENMNLTKPMQQVALKYIDKNFVQTEFLKFKNHYIANGDLKVSWEKMWENWCIQHKNFQPKQQSQKAKEKADYKWDFKKAKEVSDKIKDWLEFEKNINWLEDFYLQDKHIPGIGWQEVQHPDFNKEEILLYKIDSPNGQFMLQHKSEEIIDAQVLEND